MADLAVADEKSIFINRNPKTFGYVLDFLRNDCEISKISDEYEQNQFELELKYWGIPYYWGEPQETPK